MKTVVFNALVFTDLSLHKWTNEELENNKIQYVGYGLEVCSETSKQYHQGWLYCSNSACKSFKAWKKLFTSLGLEQMFFYRMKGSLIHNRDYCSNEGKLTELGVKPQDNGRKRTLSEYKAQIDDGKDVRALAAASAFPQYRSALQAYAHYKRGENMQTNREVPEVYVRVGPPGTGKNRWLDEQYGLSGWIEAPDNTGKWLDGCDTRDVVVFNDVDRNSIPPLHVFKKITDRYPIQRPVKGGFIWVKPKVLVFTSISHPFEWWPNLSEADKDAIMRRVTSITH